MIWIQVCVLFSSIVQIGYVNFLTQNLSPSQIEWWEKRECILVSTSRWCCWCQRQKHLKRARKLSSASHFHPFFRKRRKQCLSFGSIWFGFGYAEFCVSVCVWPNCVIQSIQVRLETNARLCSFNMHEGKERNPKLNSNMELSKAHTLHIHYTYTLIHNRTKHMLSAHTQQSHAKTFPSPKYIPHAQYSRGNWNADYYYSKVFGWDFFFARSQSVIIGEVVAVMVAMVVLLLLSPSSSSLNRKNAYFPYEWYQIMQACTLYTVLRYMWGVDQS